MKFGFFASIDCQSTSSRTFSTPTIEGCQYHLDTLLLPIGPKWALVVLINRISSLEMSELDEVEVLAPPVFQKLLAATSSLRRLRGFNALHLAHILSKSENAGWSSPLYVLRAGKCSQICSIGMEKHFILIFIGKTLKMKVKGMVHQSIAASATTSLKPYTAISLSIS